MLKTITPENWALIKEIVEPLEWDGSRCDITPNSVKITVHRPGPKLKRGASVDAWANAWQRYWETMHVVLPALFAEVEAQAAEDEAPVNVRPTGRNRKRYRLEPVEGEAPQCEEAEALRAGLDAILDRVGRDAPRGGGASCDTTNTMALASNVRGLAKRALKAATV